MTSAASTVVLGTTERVGADGFELMVLDLAELLTAGLYVQGNSGSGKSGLLRRIAEETRGRVQQLVIDAEGDYVTLAQHFDDFVVIGARDASREGHVPLPQADDRIEQLAVKLYGLGVSAIVDLSALGIDAQRHFVRVFLETLMVNAMRLRAEERHHALVFIDEVQLFAPEQQSAESTKVLVDLGFRGRKLGLHPVVATQRLSNVDKGAVSQLPNKIIGRTVFSGDQNRASEEIGLSVIEKRALRQLEPRQFIAYGPALCQEPTRFRVGDVRTRMPKVGDLESYDLPTPSPEVLAALAALGGIEDVAGRQEQQSEAPVPQAGRAARKPAAAAPACGHEAELAELRDRCVQYAAHGVAWAKEKEALQAELEAERQRTKTLRTAIDDAMAAYAKGENTDGARQIRGPKACSGSSGGRIREDDSTDLAGAANERDRRPVGTNTGSASSKDGQRPDSRDRHRGASTSGGTSGPLRPRHDRPGFAGDTPDERRRGARGGRDTEDMKDEEVETLLESKLSARLAGGAAVIVMAPAEKLRHEYQQRAVDLVMEKAGQLGPDAREVMRFMLGHFDDPMKVSMPISQIAAGVSDYRSGRPPERWNNAVKALQDAGFVGVRGRGGSTGYFPRVRDWVRNELGAHNPTIEDVEATYQAVLARIAGGVSA